MLKLRSWNIRDPFGFLVLIRLMRLGFTIGAAQAFFYVCVCVWGGVFWEYQSANKTRPRTAFLAEGPYSANLRVGM